MRVLSKWSTPPPRQAWAAAVVFALASFSLVSTDAIGLASFLFLGSALWCWRDSKRALQASWPQARWVILAFLGNLGFALFLLASRGLDLGILDEPSRMLLAVTAMLFVLAARPRARWLWWGAAGGALAGACLVAWQRFALGMPRPGALMNPITFGDLSLSLALVALASGFDQRARGTRAVAAIGALAGLAGSLLSGSRGGWIVLPFALALLVTQRQLVPRKVALALPVAAVLLVVLAYLAPQTGVRDRVLTSVSELSIYLDGNMAATSLSVRLELWKAALMLVREHPWSGLETSAYKQQMHDWVALGVLNPLVFAPPEPSHLHNDALQMLVTRGIPGFLAWAATLAAPLVFFWRQLKQADGREGRALSLAGMLFVLAYLGFGLTEVIFWSMRSCLFYAQMVFILMGLCLNAQAAQAASDTLAPASQAPADSRQDGPPIHPRQPAEKS
ncbi:MAG: O-antigen ligase family protein [Massilia sp.]